MGVLTEDEAGNDGDEVLGDQRDLVGQRAPQVGRVRGQPRGDSATGVRVDVEPTELLGHARPGSMSLGFWTLAFRA